MKISHDFHIHTNLSLCAKPEADFAGYMEMANRIGLRKVGISNHLWDAAVEKDESAFTSRNKYTRFYTVQNYDHLAQLKPEIEAYRGDVKVYFGCETEYDPFHRGVAITEETAEKFDYILVPNSHTHIMMPIENYEPYEKHAQYMIDAYLDIIRSKVSRYITAMAHPFEAVCCPYSNSFLIDMIPDDTYRRLFDETAEKGIAFEINVASMNKKTPKEIEDSSQIRVFRLAKECGCKFLFGSDAHSHAALEKYSNADLVASLLELREDDIADIAK